VRTQSFISLCWTAFIFACLGLGASVSTTQL